MRIALIADSFPPMRTSAAVQLRDLTLEFARQGHAITVLLPSSEQMEPWTLEESHGVRILRLKAPRTKELGYVRRTFNELIMPFAMLRNFRRSPLANERWDGIIWYSPSIFHGPLVKTLKSISHCRSYLILRDIFPDWAVHVGLMRRGLPYRFFDTVARYQYAVADIIGVQSSGDMELFSHWKGKEGRKLEVLPNWLAKAPFMRCSIRVNESRLAGRKVFVYAGNMGVAQGMGVLLDLAERFKQRRDIGFLFVGRGNDWHRLQREATARELANVLFHKEINPDEIPDLYAQCSVGLVALDPRHRTHNIPGKFLTYMQSGLPVLANINRGNDLAQLIQNEQVGQVCQSNEIHDLFQLANTLLTQVEEDKELPDRCRKLFERKFSVTNNVQQIVAALDPQQTFNTTGQKSL